MKKLLILLCLVSPFAYSEDVNKPVECFPVKKLFDAIQEKYDEKLYMILDGEDKNVKIALTVNQETKTWTLVEYSRTTGCIIGTGKSFKIKNSGVYL
jgi:hypothetical protein